MPEETIDQTFRGEDFELITHDDNLNFDEPATLTKGMVGEPYSNQIEVTNGVSPYECTVTVGQLPDGIEIDGDTLTGTPTQQETQTFTVAVTDAEEKTTQKQLTLEIMPALTITTS